MLDPDPESVGRPRPSFTCFYTFVSSFFLFILCTDWYQGQSIQVAILYRHGAESCPRRGRLLRRVFIERFRILSSFSSQDVIPLYFSFSWINILPLLSTASLYSPLSLSYILHCRYLPSAHSLLATMYSAVSILIVLLYLMIKICSSKLRRFLSWSPLHL